MWWSYILQSHITQLYDIEKVIIIQHSNNMLALWKAHELENRLVVVYV